MNIEENIADAMANLLWHVEHSGPQPVIDQIDAWLQEPDQDAQPWHDFLADGVKNAVNQAHPLQSGRTIISIRYPKNGEEVSFEFEPKAKGGSEYHKCVTGAVNCALAGKPEEEL